MGFSLLLVDDSSVARRYVRKEMLSIFADEEINVTELSNGKEACDACVGNQYSLVVLDLTMPVMTGYDVLEYLKNNGVTQKIIVLSADIQSGVSEIVKGLGAIGYLKKPFNRGQMVTLLKENGFNVKC
ncbi:MAG: response regulator [Nitrospirae bacterium]|nr:response regulator [Nitrospirota bacterium]